MSVSGWIGVDLDATLAEYHGWNDGKIGNPIPRMVQKVQRKLAEGVKVKIFTARVGVDPTMYSSESNASATQEFADEQRRLIEDWCLEHIGQVLEVTATKDFACIEIWDDRCKQVEPNTGKFVGEADIMLLSEQDLAEENPMM